MASEDLAAPSSASARAKNDIIGVADSPNDQVDVKEGTLEHDEHGNYKRSITPRHMHIISLAYCMGSGVFINLGLVLTGSGPGNMVIGYAVVCSCVWAVLQTSAEMTIAFPVSGNIFDFVDRWVDPSLAFAAGFAEWFGWCAVIGAEAVWTHVLISFWAGEDWPAAASYTLLCIAAYAIFLGPTKVFAWFMYFAALVKILLFLIIFFLSLALIGSAGPTGSVRDGSTWTEMTPFKNGFSGFASATLFAVWASGDQVFMGIMAGEAQNPRFSMGHATKLVPWRISMVYMSLVIFTGILVPSNDDRLTLGSTVSASPFVVAAQDAGIKGIPDVINAFMMIAILSMAVEAIYISSRVLRTMAHQKLVPEVLAKLDKRGQPIFSLLISAAAGVLLTFINLAADGATAFVWLISITSASYFTMWMIIALTSWRFHQALKQQNDPLFQQLYAWRSVAWPLAPVWLFICSVFFAICCIYLGVKPLGGGGFSAANFFQYVLGMLVIFIFTAAYKIIRRTPWRDPATADLTTGRRTLSVEEIQELDAYYSQPQWRRFMSYVQLW